MAAFMLLLTATDPVIPDAWGEPLLIAGIVAATTYAVRQVERRIVRAETKEDEYRKEVQTTTTLLADLTSAFRELKETVLDDRHDPPDPPARTRRA